MSQILSKTLYDVFINYRRVDTKNNVAGLIYQNLSSRGLKPFLDNKSMKAGDRLHEKIDHAIKGCQVGVAIFSPRYCESYFCLHELALMMECNKKVIPIFCDVKPSKIQIIETRDYSLEELEKFNRAIKEAKNIIGLGFDTLNGDWSEFLTRATDSILGSLHEIKEDEM